jgi:hypothetical protein
MISSSLRNDGDRPRCDAAVSRDRAGNLEHAEEFPEPLADREPDFEKPLLATGDRGDLVAVPAATDPATADHPPVLSVQVPPAGVERSTYPHPPFTPVVGSAGEGAVEAMGQIGILEARDVKNVGDWTG